MTASNSLRAPVASENRSNRNRELARGRTGCQHRITALDWTADGKALLISSRVQGDLALLLVDLQGSARVLWHTLAGSDETTIVVPSPDGRHLAILGWSEKWQYLDDAELLTALGIALTRRLSGRRINRTLERRIRLRSYRLPPAAANIFEPAGAVVFTHHGPHPAAVITGRA